MVRLGAAIGIAGILMCVAGVMAPEELAGVFVIGGMVCLIVATLVDRFSRPKGTPLQYHHGYDEVVLQRWIGSDFSRGHHSGGSGHHGGSSGGHFDGGGGGGHSGSH